MPCNYHLRALGAKVKEGIRAAGKITDEELSAVESARGAPCENRRDAGSAALKR